MYIILVGLVAIGLLMLIEAWVTNQKQVISKKIAAQLYSNNELQTMAIVVDFTKNRILASKNMLNKHIFPIHNNNPKSQLHPNNIISLLAEIKNGTKTYKEVIIREGRHTLYGEAKAIKKGSKIYGANIIFHSNKKHVIKVAHLNKTISNLNERIKTLSTILNKIDCPTWIRNANLEIEYFNEEYCKYIENKPIDKQITSLELNKDITNTAQRAHIAQRDITSISYITSKQSVQILEVTESPIPHSNKQIGFAKNITQIKMLEREAKKQNNTYQNLIDSLSSAITIYDTNKKLVFYNNAFSRLTGISQAFLDKNPSYSDVLDRMHENRKLPEQANFKKFKENQLDLFTNLLETHNEFYYLPDGSALMVVMIPNGIDGLLFSYEDITDKLTLEQSYNTATNTLQTALNHVSEGLAVYGENGRIKLYNKQFMKIWGLNKHYLGSKPHIAEILNKISEKHKIAKWNSFKTKEILAITNHITTPATIKIDPDRIIKRNITKLPDGSVMASYNDITDSSLLEMSLRERNNLLSDLSHFRSKLIQSLAQEITTPINKIHMLAESTAKNMTAQDYACSANTVQKIIEESTNLTTTVQNITTLSLLEAELPNLPIYEHPIGKIQKTLQQEIQKHNQFNAIEMQININNKQTLTTYNQHALTQGIVQLCHHALNIMHKLKYIQIQIDTQQSDMVIIIDCKTNQYKKDILYDTNNISTISGITDTTETNTHIISAKKFIAWHKGNIASKRIRKNRIVYACIIPLTQNTSNLKVPDGNSNIPNTIINNHTRTTSTL